MASKRARYWSVWTLCAFLLSSTAVKADPDSSWVVDALDKSGQESDIAKGYLLGAVDGLSWADARLFNRQHKHFYCQPKSLALQPAQIFSIFKSFVSKNPEQRSQPAGFVMLLALQDVFPCGPADELAKEGK